MVGCDPFTGLSTNVSSVQPSISSSSSFSLGDPLAFILISSLRGLEAPAGGDEEPSPRVVLLSALADWLA